MRDIRVRLFGSLCPSSAPKSFRVSTQMIPSVGSVSGIEYCTPLGKAFISCNCLSVMSARYRVVKHEPHLVSLDQSWKTRNKGPRCTSLSIRALILPGNSFLEISSEVPYRKCYDILISCGPPKGLSPYVSLVRDILSVTR